MSTTELDEIEATETGEVEAGEQFPPIRVIYTRNPLSSLEGSFFWALLLYGGEMLFKALGIALDVEFRFKSTFQRRKPIPPSKAFREAHPELNKKELAEAWLEEHHNELQRKGIVYFNVGDNYGHGFWDHHGMEGTYSAIDILRWGENDFLNLHPELLHVYLAISANDSTGKRLRRKSRGPDLRKLMQGMSAAYPDQDQFQVVFNTMTLALLGVFQRCGVVPDEDFDHVFQLDQIQSGVVERAPDQSDWFNRRASEAMKAVDAHWRLSQIAVTVAEVSGRTGDIFHPVLSPAIGRSLRVIEIRSNTVNAAQAARFARACEGNLAYDLVIVRRIRRIDGKNRLGQCQVFSSIMNQEDDRGRVIAKWRLDLSPIAKELRLFEANIARPRRQLEAGLDWAGPGTIFDVHGKAIPWHLTEFLSAILNGSLSAWDMPVTAINHKKLVAVICETLPKCRLLKENEEAGTWDHAVPVIPRRDRQDRSQDRRPDQRQGRGGWRPGPRRDRNGRNGRQDQRDR